jgi:hypothetical protein
VAVVAVRPVLHEAEMIGAEPRREVELRDDLPLDTGRVIAAFAADSDALSLTGRVLTSVELAKRYRAMAASAAIPESKR